ncbi:hypothetical protein P7M32_01200 [Bisgaard Taxon 10/6]|uniref:Lipoprotein n=1 Tax=Exercitatus varius TaxID=67857 RepID=A0ABT6ENE7_9PAST|nr:hypothetical protein [Exercitatus varius]MDG2939377.1 hypothetical protein [Exercitatus varius]MDG2945057.1 hypothetical protein [Exercitatus varius]MDG2958809.1 hypothetical protein [Exercitatus varius]
MKKILLCSLASLFLVGCAANNTVILKNSFNEAEAQKLLTKGTNTITGSSFMRQKGGTVVTCAGQSVSLVPATSYAAERMTYIYRSDIKGAIPFNMFNELPSPKFVNEPANFKNYSIKTVCDAQGNFTFENVADGDFYVVSIIYWDIGNVSMDFGARQGGSLMQKVTVKNSETKKIILTP